MKRRKPPIDIRELQKAHKEWAEKSLADFEANDGFIGLVEELGELAHIRLKAKQGIREYYSGKYRSPLLGLRRFKEITTKRNAAIADAIGDIFVFLMHYASAAGFDLENCIRETWDKVQQRNWVKFPRNGLTK